jgi:hypothetical protein
VRLAALAGEGLLGIELVPSPADPWTFVGATPLPDLRLGGSDLLDALVDALRGESTGAGVPGDADAARNAGEGGAGAGDAGG